ncbi:MULTISPECIES: TolC family outer membrane protein [unclassified Pseudomonas]|uniref:TolC family outer membrane protein n=2 Tax=Pseudomonas TaxID=286 RepID=UPI000C883C77|nr:peptidase [Pseudomonas sp. FW305-42]PNA24620.1 peptidase [Pseudomonas sp. MPR-R1B]PNB23171.1 peptidase [Pseudomonas sp. DP16D-E2]PNB43191.1 peptidase [Pseudomonas sp. FW305-17]PNB56095.1 peptidase [Pseudomonas sp. GW531-E2]PNB67554.1 peptidase [Pseudomonas sp. FW305-127]
MKKFPLIGLLLACAWLPTAAQAAMGPFQVYEQALRRDPTYLAAFKAREAGQEYRAIGRAGLLPSLSYSYNKGRNDSEVRYLGDSRRQKEDRTYNSMGSTFILQQPLFDYEAYSSYRKGMAQALFADESFRDQSQQLLVRVMTSYTQALFAQDQIAISVASKQAYRQQFQQNQRLFDAGEGTRTDILEAQARYELADAEEIKARNEQDAALRELGALIGEPAVRVEDLAPLRLGFALPVVDPSGYEAWQERALANNPQLSSSRQALEVARYEVERNRAGHLPKVTAFATSRRQESDSGNTYNQRYDTNTVGIEVSVPIFAGGGVLASTRQASRHLEQAEYELDGNTRSALIELRKQYNACQSGASQLRAYERALVAAEALVVSTRKSVQGGERVNLDVLNAEQQLATTRRDLAQARYDYLLAWIKLHYQAGVLSETQLARVDEAFIEGKP